MDELERSILGIIEAVVVLNVMVFGGCWAIDALWQRWKKKR